MSNLEQLMALGAEIVGGSLLWKHKELGTLRNGDFFISEEGKKALLIENVEVKEIMAAAKPAKARTAKTPKDYQAGDELQIEID